MFDHSIFCNFWTIKKFKTAKNAISQKKFWFIWFHEFFCLDFFEIFWSALYFFFVKSVYFYFIFNFTIFCTDRDDPRLVVRLQNGRIRGVNLNLDVRAWLGIPYAEPPTGRYRFARPRQLRNWDRDYIRDTVILPNACPQTPDEFFGNFSGK